jgi:D-3-phosphoglycerate dehydrogenase
MKVAIVGKYALGTIDRIRELLPTDFEIMEIDTTEELDKLKDADAAVLRGFRINEKHISQINNLKFIQRWGAGYDTVDIEAAGKRGIYVSNLPGMNSYAVSEMVIAHILAIYKNLINHHNFLSNGIWTRDTYNERTYTLKNKLVGLIGFGNIGRQVCQKVKCFGAHVQYNDIYRLDASEEESIGIKYVEIEELLKTSDIISIHVPLTEGNKNLINIANISIMKKTAVVINTSRGGIVNETDLYDALVNNRILGAGLDCFAAEPIERGNPLLKLDNVVLTPHVGGASADLADEMIPQVVDNIMRLKNNEELMYVVNRSYLRKV